MIPAFVRATQAKKSHYLPTAPLPCLPVLGNIDGAYPVVVVLKSIKAKGSPKILADANAIIPETLLLSGVRPYSQKNGGIVSHYRPSHHDLAVRFQNARVQLNSKTAVRVTGAFRAAGTKRAVCFVSTWMPTCSTRFASKGGPSYINKWHSMI